MKKLLIVFLLAGGFAFSQPMSQYQYVIVPAKFDAQRKPGQFGLNNLTKLFLEKNGYKVFYDTDILPPEVSGESCNKIYADVLENNTIRTTKLRVQVKDCRNAILFLSDYGTSSEKDNQVAYNQALRAAFKSFDKPEYRYNASGNGIPVKVVEAVAPAPPKPFQAKVIETIAGEPNILSAQKIENGYQLVDTTPKIVLRLFETSQPNIFLAEGEGKNGIVVKKGTQWFLEYYKNKQLNIEPIDIKF
jgi:hypothetical protein